MLFVITVSLTVKTPVTVWDNFVHPGRIECTWLFRQPRNGSMFDVFVAGDSISWQVFLQGVRHIRLAGCKTRTVWMIVQRFPAKIPHNLLVCFIVCSRPLLCTAIAPSLRSGHFPWSQKSCNSADYRMRPVSQVGQHVELPQLCSFCACASNHVTANTVALCRTY
jgi:hypothetical protein